MKILTDLSIVLNVPLFEISLFILLLLQIPVSAAYRLFSSKTKQGVFLRHFYGLFIGLLLCLILYETSHVAFLFFYSVLLYPLLKKINGSRFYFLSVALCFSFLSFIHLRKFMEIGDESENNLRFILMIIVPKIIYFANHVFNAQRKSKSVPSLFEYLSYLFNFLGNSVLPIYSFDEFEAFIHCSYSSRALLKKPFLKNLVLWILACAVFIFLPKYFDHDFLLAHEFRQLSFAGQILYIMICALIMRCRYYGGWVLANLHMIAADFRCSEEKYSTYVSTINVLEFELNSSPKLHVGHWNTSIAKWLKRCFYLPAIKNAMVGREAASVFTFLVSAFWHGFSAAYYIVFIGFYLNVAIERFVADSRLLKELFPKLLYFFMFDLATIIFKYLEWDKTKTLIKNLSWFYIGFASVFLVCLILSKVTKLPRYQRIEKLLLGEL